MLKAISDGSEQVAQFLKFNTNFVILLKSIFIMQTVRSYEQTKAGNQEV